MNISAKLICIVLLLCMVACKKDKDRQTNIFLGTYIPEGTIITDSTRMFVPGKEITDYSVIRDFVKRHEFDDYFKDPSDVFHQNTESDLLINWKNDTAITIRGYSGTSDTVKFEALFKDNDEILLRSKDTMVYLFPTTGSCGELALSTLKYSSILSCRYSNSHQKRCSFRNALPLIYREGKMYLPSASFVALHISEEKKCHYAGDNYWNIPGENFLEYIGAGDTVLTQSTRFVLKKI